MNFRCAFLLLVLLQSLATMAAPVSELSRDEQIVFFPTLGAHVDEGTNWELQIAGCVYEPESRRLTLAALREALELKHAEMTGAEEATFKQRARLFLADNERGHRVVARIGSRVLDLGKSAPNGHFSGTARLTEAELDLGGGNLDGRSVGIMALLKPKDRRTFTGRVLLLEDEGLSVVSDIDDTIKITEVRDHHAMLHNTFLRQFQPVPGMAEFYQTLARSNRAVFHYVSASPWQLYTALAEFARSNGFPRGTFHLKTFRWKDRSLLSLFSDPERYKTAVIEPLLRRFSNRHFILVGDSGERDPEIYAALARKFPQQIERIYLRNVTDEPVDAERYGKTFGGLPAQLWTVFREPPARSK